MQPKPVSTLTDNPMPMRRSQGQIVVARALWYVKPGVCEIRNERLQPLQPGEARVATLFTSISRGTERLVANGEVPESEWTRMRAPFQSGSFPYPVKYGYSAAGIVTAGSEALLGKTVFCLHPHQDHFQVPGNMLAVVPDHIPAKRATLAANMETALNAIWDSGTQPGDKVLIVGAGIVGLLTAHLARQMFASRVVITDIDPTKGPVAEALGIDFTLPGDVPPDNRIVFHTSASSKGLETAIAAAAFEGRIVELSWYGDRPTTLHLGGAFHSRRLQIICSQVGHVAPSQRSSVTHSQRLATAISMLDDPRLDRLVEHEISFEDLPQKLSQIFAAPSATICPVIRFPKA
jgi:2-desacetyl-2-hydroxyethyl bacteriochlorophyllide A dehydrogenase